MEIQQQFWKTQQLALQRRLETFEVCIETPLIPGELARWLHDAQRALEMLIPQLQLQTQHIHANEFAEIVKEDPGLFGRVKELREEDGQLMARQEQIVDCLEQIRQALEGGAGETELKEELQDLVSQSLEWVMRTRKQEVAIRTWLVEAFTRDRGTVD